MLLQLPVVTYKTSGTPFLNKDGETVLLSEIGNIEKLAMNMLTLIDSPYLSQKLSENAKAFAEKEFDNTASAKRLLRNYYAVMNHYYHNVIVPEELLFDIKEFPLY